MISHLFPIDFSLLYLSISCPFLLSPENKSKKYWYILLFFIFLHSKTEEKPHDLTMRFFRENGI